MKNLTIEEFYDIVQAAFAQLTEYQCLANCYESDRTVTAARIYTSLVKLYDKVYRKGEGSISTGKICRCIAKNVQTERDETLFTGCFTNSPIKPRLKDHAPEAQN